MKTIAKTSAVLLGALMLLTACETMQGFGRDTNKLGNDVTKGAEKHDLDNDPNR